MSPSNNYPKLIALAGYQRVGKSTAAKYLAEQYGYTIISFASVLKDMLRAIGLTEEEVNGSLKNTPCELLGGKTPIYALQKLGTEYCREMIHPDFLANIWHRRVLAALSDGKRVVTDDMRFENEHTAIRKKGGYVILITRMGYSRQSDHESERFVEEIVTGRRGGYHDFAVENPLDRPFELQSGLDTILVGTACKEVTANGPFGEFYPTHKHFKGGLYQLLGPVVNRTNGDDDLRPSVVYRDSSGALHRRLTAEFNGVITINGQTVRRFSEL